MTERTIGVIKAQKLAREALSLLKEGDQKAANRRWQLAVCLFSSQLSTESIRVSSH